MYKTSFTSYLCSRRIIQFPGQLGNSQEIHRLTGVIMVPLYNHVEVILLLPSLPCSPPTLPSLPPSIFLSSLLILLQPWNSVFLTNPGRNMRNAVPLTAILRHRKVLRSCVRLQNPLCSLVYLESAAASLAYVGFSCLLSQKGGADVIQT